ncbi:hypothetical protein ROG8370_01567 [Roseovarius gaetbuli]|uniref:Polymer-forming cytoskeletal n=1 Tax=Roseovarius gaetbuli TaxID=1356575 RepID=A0A1X6Z412_9RHOB|nr:EI24 domain-containing protein [Roseovarius gaetbuli]SLN38033.1 hypothetical protein ROG8370_01567 [Roseovarius gaetbuli]
MPLSLSRHIAALCLLVGLALPALGEPVTVTRSGSDTFMSGASITETLDTQGDSFIAAQSAVARGVSEGDLHVAGFDVSVSADTREDLYAFGATVVLRGAIARDLTAAGISLRTEDSAQTSGNARLLGKTVTIEGPVAGALSVSGREVVLNAPITGDVRILAKTLSFGPKAVVTGTLTYSMEDRIDVPEQVAPASRVVFKKLSPLEVWDEFVDMGRMREMPMLPTFASIVFGFIISLLFFVALGALALGVMPKRLEAMRKSIVAGPGRTLIAGIAGLSVLFGMVPVTGLTIVGLPFVPIVVLGIIAAWTLGYALGAYAVAMRVWVGFGGDPEAGTAARLVVFAGAIIVIALLNFIPFVGWVANYTLVLLGIGAMTTTLLTHFIGNSGQSLDVDMKPTKT